MIRLVRVYVIDKAGNVIASKGYSSDEAFDMLLMETYSNMYAREIDGGGRVVVIDALELISLAAAGGR